MAPAVSFTWIWSAPWVYCCDCDDADPYLSLDFSSCLFSRGSVNGICPDKGRVEERCETEEGIKLQTEWWADAYEMSTPADEAENRDKATAGSCCEGERVS